MALIQRPLLSQFNTDAFYSLEALYTGLYMFPKFSQISLQYQSAVHIGILQ